MEEEWAALALLQEMRGEGNLSSLERESQGWSSNTNALSLHGFFLLPEKRSKYFLLELQDMFQQFHVDHSLDIKCLTNGHKKAQ